MGLDAGSHMHAHALLACCLPMRLLGHEPLTPPPSWGTNLRGGRCVLLLVRNNQPRPITFTARRAFQCRDTLSSERDGWLRGDRGKSHFIYS